MRAWLSLLLLVAGACTAVTDFDPERWEEEGRVACADGADNDDNGLVDCAESACQAEANCRCNPSEREQTGCSRGEGCYLARIDETTTFRFCAEAGGGIQGAPCSSNVECQVGFTCVHRDDQPRCARTCTRSQGSMQCIELADDAVCVPLGTGYIIEGTEYGVCVEPDAG